MTAKVQAVGIERWWFGVGERAIQAVGPFDISIEDGEFVCVVGPSGCGKSSLVRMRSSLGVLSQALVAWIGRKLAAVGSAAMTLNRRTPAESAESDLGLFLTDPAGVDPHPIFQRMRADDPVHWSSALQSWWVTSYPLVVEMTRDQRWSSMPTSAANFDPEAPRAAAHCMMDQMVSRRDAPDHTNFRKLSNRRFSNKAAEGLRGAVRLRANEYVDRVVAMGNFDLVADLAFEYPLTITCDTMGIPNSEHERIHRWSAAYAGMLVPDPSAEVLEAGREMFGEVGEFVETLVRSRQVDDTSSGSDDFLTHLVLAHRRGELTSDELVSSWWNIIFASHETTTGMIANGIVTLLEHRNEWVKLVADPDLVVSATEEIMRFESGAITILPRFPLEDIRLGEKLIRKGERVFASVTAADRDPSVFENPDTFNIERSTSPPQIGFGWGPHLCLGAPLARVECQEILRALATKAPGLCFDGTVTAKKSWQFRGPAEAPLAIDDAHRTTSRTT